MPMYNSDFISECFHSIETSGTPLPRLYGVGTERRVVPHSYEWDCLNRPDPHFIFQYSVSGEGEIYIDGVRHRLLPGDAFLIEVPGPYYYRLPNHSPHWEFKYVSLTTEFSFLWKKVILLAGRIIRLDESSDILHYWNVLFELLTTDPDQDKYLCSEYGYNFLIRLLRWAEQNSMNTSTLPAFPPSVLQCLELIKTSHHLNIGIEDLARSAQVSRGHLTRLFREYLNTTPQHYLIEARLKSAARMLSSSTLSVEQIAQRCGFSNGNYFAKVFRKWNGINPSEFRENQMTFTPIKQIQ
ncbi:hypothetical protein B1748_04980 [Paenibacillus sp. MY03]|jgi:AraC-like DNA-binding protein|uniref:helix-turn-helix transcriptional regulator n=1 Tax=Paenibacillus sp. MY03 TaxID=302980 RepID=UPI000B3C283D|nr:AraC family transcriptional regulator [Paenibacillus sp. MY03]OUS78118.1 hypothetical protein B1748_04980 [Paenibacillus sp. MY03]